VSIDGPKLDKLTMPARGCPGSPAEGELVMGKHETPPLGSEQDGKAELDAAGLAKLAKEPEGGRHSAAEDEADPEEAEE